MRPARIPHFAREGESAVVDAFPEIKRMLALRDSA
jgi:hypothetical protein